MRAYRDKVRRISRATWLTLIRLGLVPPMLLMAHGSVTRWFVPLLVLLWITMVSDVLDGWLARTDGECTALGGFLDPLVDKVLVYSLAFTFYGYGVFWPWTVFPIFIRDSLVDGWRSYRAAQGKVLPANRWGKIKFSLQFVSLNAAIMAFCVPQHFFRPFATIANLALLTALIVSLPGLFSLSAILDKSK